MDFVGKKYKMTSSENFDEFMKAIGEFLIIIFDVQKYFSEDLTPCCPPAGFR